MMINDLIIHIIYFEIVRDIDNKDFLIVVWSMKE